MSAHSGKQTRRWVGGFLCNSSTDSADYMDPADLPGARFAWFSPGCTHHSPANAKKLYQRGRQRTIFEGEDDFDEVAYANSERSRVTMSCVLRYAEKHKPEILVVENVVEVTLWGPGRDGSTFAWWKRTLEKIGYEIQCLFLNSCFFPPCPQSRDRIYIVGSRKGNIRPNLDYRPIAYCTSNRCGGRHISAIQTWKRATKAWPLPQWGKYKRQYLYTCPHCNNQVEPAAWPAYTAINWSNLGPSLAVWVPALNEICPALNEIARTISIKLRASNLMISVGFKRVSKTRPCRICGKPTYCCFSRDEGTSICMRISAGSRGLSRNGGNIHVHPEIPFITIRPKIKNANSQSISLAPLEIRDAVFREFIRLSPPQITWRNLSLDQEGCCHEGSRTTQPAMEHCLEQNRSVQPLPQS
jgi:C-5 cytosine-specific DNA methylase